LLPPFPVGRDSIPFQIGHLVLFILGPAFDRKKEILFDLWPGVAHSITNFHGRKFLMEIDGEIFLLDRDVGRFLVI
jgi:hypothetical protein